MGYKMTPELAKKAYEDYNVLGSLVKVGRKYDVTPMCLYKCFRNMGLKINNKTEAGKAKIAMRNRALREMYESRKYPSLVTLSEALNVSTITAKRGLEEIYSPKTVRELFPFSRVSARRNLHKATKPAIQVVTPSGVARKVEVATPVAALPKAVDVPKPAEAPKADKPDENKKGLMDMLPPPEKVKSLKDRLFSILE